MNIQYEVKLTDQKMIDSSLFTWAEMGFACHINDELKKQGAPHIETGFIMPEKWFKEIMSKYTSMTRTTCKETGAVTFVFKIEEDKDGRN